MEQHIRMLKKTLLHNYTCCSLIPNRQWMTQQTLTEG